MEIKYNCDKKFFKMINETAEIISLRKSIIQNKKIKTYGALQRILLYYFFGLIVYFFYISSKYIFFWPEILNDLFMISSMTINIITTLYLLLFITFYLAMKKDFCTEETIIIDEWGITDLNDLGTMLGLKWNAIGLIAITKNAITILNHSGSYMIFLDIEQKEKIMEEILKFSQDVLIVDYSKNIS